MVQLHGCPIAWLSVVNHKCDSIGSPINHVQSSLDVEALFEEQQILLYHSDRPSRGHLRRLAMQAHTQV